MKINNFDIYWNSKLIRDILNKQEDLSDSLRNFILTQHEKDVLDAFKDLVQFSKQSLVKHKWNVKASTLKQYTDIIQDNIRLINWTLLLHDIAKNRDFPDPHPDHSYYIIHTYGKDIQSIAHLSNEQWEQLEWMVRYHDVMGNINTGERSPKYLNHITSTFSGKVRKHNLELLSLITLCDVQGTNQGMYLTDEKARFWLQLSDNNFIKKLENNLLNHRIKRWTGDLLTEPNFEKEKKINHLIKEKGHEKLFKTFWGSQITHIVHGIYLFIELSEQHLDLLFQLLEQIALMCEKEIPHADNIQVNFYPFKPWIEEDKIIFKNYMRDILNNNLEFKFEQNVIKVRSHN